MDRCRRDALFTFGKFVIGLYLGRGGVGSDYGPAASIIIMIVGVYYSAQILFWAQNLPKFMRVDTAPVLFPPKEPSPSVVKNVPRSTCLGRFCITIHWWLGYLRALLNGGGVVRWIFHRAKVEVK